MLVGWSIPKSFLSSNSSPRYQTISTISIIKCNWDIQIVSTLLIIVFASKIFIFLSYAQWYYLNFGDKKSWSNMYFFYALDLIKCHHMLKTLVVKTWSRRLQSKKHAFCLLKHLTLVEILKISASNLSRAL